MEMQISKFLVHIEDRR